LAIALGCPPFLVELHLKTGEIRRIGTDDASGLPAALRGE
jgi:hypothetical protein